jgi:hypothetical protein
MFCLQNPLSRFVKSAEEDESGPKRDATADAGETGVGATEEPAAGVAVGNERTEDKTEEDSSSYYAVFVGGLTTFVPPHLLKEAFSACGL